MTWKHWVLILAFALSACVSIWYAERPRPAKSRLQVTCDLAELSFYVWLVLSI